MRASREEKAFDRKVLKGFAKVAKKSKSKLGHYASERVREAAG
jgi:hypothetical protein